jgi:integrase
MGGAVDVWEERKLTLVGDTYLGYKSGMRHEIIAAPGWGTPLAEYLKMLVASRTAPSTVQMRSYQIRTLSRAMLDTRPEQVTGRALTAFLASKGDSWCDAAARSARSAYRSFFTWLFENDDYPEAEQNPALVLRKIPSPQGRPHPAPIGEVERAVEAADQLKDKRIRWMILLGAHVGLRRSEISRVHTDDLVQDSDGWSLRILGKGNKERFVPLTPELSDWLLAMPAGWAFPSEHRGVDVGHLSADRVGKLISRILAPGVHPHMLRHRFATDFYVATGNDLLTVREALGHASVATTQVYTQIPRSAMRRGIDAMAARSLAG